MTSDATVGFLRLHGEGTATKSGFSGQNQIPKPPITAEGGNFGGTLLEKVDDGSQYSTQDFKSQPNNTRLVLNSEVLEAAHACNPIPPTVVTDSRLTLGSTSTSGNDSYDLSAQTNNLSGDPNIKSKPLPRSLTRFARKSWISASRSPSLSPSKPEIIECENSLTDTITGTSSFKLNPLSQTRYNHRSNMKAEKFHMSSKTFNDADRRQKMPQSISPSKPLSTSDEPALPFIRSTLSTEKLPEIYYQPSETLSLIPRSMSSDRLQGMGTEFFRRKDDLWNSFRTLDNEYQKQVVLLNLIMFYLI